MLSSWRKVSPISQASRRLEIVKIDQCPRTTLSDEGGPRAEGEEEATRISQQEGGVEGHPQEGGDREETLLDIEDKTMEGSNLNDPGHQGKTLVEACAMKYVRDHF